MPVKKYVVLAALVAVVSYLILTQDKKSEVLEASSMAGGNYCMAIRGNGEMEPAHWGAAARVIEQWGMPSAMAGGSSASISMFVLNAVAQNPFIRDTSADQAEKNRRAALAVKSFLGFFTELKETQFSKDFFKLYGEFDQAKAQGLTNQMAAELVKEHFAEVAGLVQKGTKEGFFSIVSIQPFILALNHKDMQHAKFYMQQLQETVSLFGKFDAATDANLFFRPGLVNFANAAENFGRWAAFYAVQTDDEQTLNAWTKFYQECSVPSEGKSWSGLLKDKPVCGDLFHNIFEAYFDHEPQKNFEDQMIGRPIAVYPSTAVLVNSAAEDAIQGFKDYDAKMDPKFGDSFKIRNPEDVRFGYWGEPAALARIQAALDPQDEQSRRFYPLGKATWKQVLSMSPAEPGLSPLLPFPDGKMVSAGGWSDLHPITLLKAAGCEHVVFLTREGGESPFAQGVANRLMSLNQDPKKFATAVNDSGDPDADPKGVWSRLFNMSNPKSSVNTALAKASAVACTNWNVYDVKKDLIPMIENSYATAFWIPKDIAASVPLQPMLAQPRPGCQPVVQ